MSDDHSEACIPIYANRTVKSIISIPFSIMSTPFKTLESLFIYYPLYDPEAFHTGNYTKITHQCGCVFYKQKSPTNVGLDSNNSTIYISNY